MARVVNQRELQEVFGVSHQTMANWMREGMPVLTRGESGQEHQYDTANVIEWYAARAVAKCDRESAKDDLLRLQAEKIRREFDLADGVLIRADEIEAAWGSIVVAIRQALLDVPVRLAPSLEAAPGVDAKRMLLDEEIREVLLKLSRGDDDEGAVDVSGSARVAHVVNPPTQLPPSN